MLLSLLFLFSLENRGKHEKQKVQFFLYENRMTSVLEPPVEIYSFEHMQNYFLRKQFHREDRNRQFFPANEWKSSFSQPVMCRSDTSPMIADLTLASTMPSIMTRPRKPCFFICMWSFIHWLVVPLNDSIVTAHDTKETCQKCQKHRNISKLSIEHIRKVHFSAIS